MLFQSERKISRQEAGRIGEREALHLLRKEGYRLVGRNIRCRLGEIDLVAFSGNVLCFIEVKTRLDLRFGWPEEAVTPLKQARLKRLALWYCQTRRLGETPARFDVVCVLLGPDGTVARTRLIKGAFE
ncbi:MAG: YraN family protein [Candidatus Omnitrophica bacterium]|nr:YraN family protein [Candidatus Omnitrophota bacterium]